jgi:hypothetical protein
MDSQTALEILSNMDRQYIIEELLKNGGRSNVGILSEQLAARRENDADETDQERAKLELYHNHLPRLADHGVINYDKGNGNIVLKDATGLISYMSNATRKRSIPLDS